MLHIVKLIERRHPRHARLIVALLVALSATLLAVGIALLRAG
jgi:hypothetical protein